VCSGSLFPPPFLLLLRIDNKSSPIFFFSPLPSLIMTSHQWAISVIKIKTVGSCTIFLFCLVDLFFLFFLLVLRAYRKTGRSVAATNPFKDFPKSFGCFVGEAKRRTLAVLLSLISSLGIQTQMPCSTFPFHLAAAKMQ
jgi:hypothetical protein